MKLLVLILALVLTVSAAFVPSQPAFVSRAALYVVTGAQGKPASSKEEDMELTREIIFRHIAGEPDEPETPPEPVAEVAAPELVHEEAPPAVTVPADE